MEPAVDPVEASSPNGMRFRVEEVIESPTKSGGSVESRRGVDGASGAPQEANLRTVGTIGYSTSEAVPMTVFYRNQDTNAPSKARPTLAELHNDHDDEMDATTHLLGRVPDLAGAERINSIASADAETARATAAEQPVVVKFGWIKGVLVRCLLNIWGVMLFLRLSWVVGQAGIGQTILVILLATVVTVITTLSMSAICTNGEVRGGGAYYLISRSLGPEFGGSIGIVFSVANAVAVALYVVGFAETVRDILKEQDSLFLSETWVVRIVGLITVCLLLGIALIGMTWEARAQSILLVLLLIAIVNFIIGSFIGPKTETERLQGFVGYSGAVHDANFGSDYREGESFFSVFAIFFPAATGILAGANISGDLKNPQKAIPKGTLTAIVVSSLLYIVMAWMVGASVVRDAPGAINATLIVANGTCPVGGCEFGLLNTFQNMEIVSGFKWLITAGIFSATLSSALASLVGAPKVFQAVCKDRLFPYIHFFAKGAGASGTEPHRGYFLAFFIAIAFIMIGDLNAIAPIISNFFLLSYALINFSCFNASFGNSPGWRPAFKYYNMFLALLGSLLCLGIMFVINWWQALITLALVAFLFMYIDYKKPKVNWGSSGQALTYSNALRFCSKLDTTDDHVKNYRPQILVLSGLPGDRPDLTWFAHCITKDVSMMICGNVLQGAESFQSRQVQRERNNRWLAANKIKAFHRVVVYNDFRDGAVSLMQSSGLGKMRPNILLLGYKSDWLGCLDTPELKNYANVLHDAFDLSYAVAILRLPSSGFYREQRECEGIEYGDVVGKRLAMATEASSMENIASGVTFKRDADEVRLPGSQVSSADPVPSAVPSSVPSAVPSSVPSSVLSTDNALRPSDARATPAAATATASPAGTAAAAAAPGKNYGVRRMQAHHNTVDTQSLFCKGKKMSGTIDVWWLHDDGGLTILLPHLLSLSSQFRGCKLRVFTQGSSTKITSERLRMTTLLNKFRIEFSSVEIITDFNKHPSEESMEMADNLPGWTDLRDNDNSKHKLLRQVRIGELIRERSSGACLVVVTMPVGRKKDVSTNMYMSWLEALTYNQSAPILMVRGNQSNVITFYS